MITESLITFLLMSFRVVVGILPTWVVPVPSFTTMTTLIGDFAARANGYFPVTLTFTCAASIFAVKVGLLAWRVIIFIYHQFWGSN